MCRTTQVFTTCRLCGHASLTLPLAQTTPCASSPDCDMTYASDFREGTDDVCDPCRLVGLWKEFDPYDVEEPFERRAAPTFEDAEKRGTMTVRDWEIAFHEQKMLIEQVKCHFVHELPGDETHVVTDRAVAFRTKLNRHLRPHIQLAMQLLQDDEDTQKIVAVSGPESSSSLGALARGGEAAGDTGLSFRGRVQRPDFSHRGVQQALHLAQSEHGQPLIHRPTPRRPKTLSVIPEEDEENAGDDHAAVTQVNGQTDADADDKLELWLKSRQESRKEILSPLSAFDRAFGRGADVSINF